MLGDRWTLLVVRDLVRGKRRFADFLDSSERIPTNILADRLKRLQRAGIVAARRYSDRPPRMEYVLTQGAKISARSCARWWRGAFGTPVAGCLRPSAGFERVAPRPFD